MLESQTPEAEDSQVLRSSSCPTFEDHIPEKKSPIYLVGMDASRKEGPILS